MDPILSQAFKLEEVLGHSSLLKKSMLLSFRRFWVQSTFKLFMMPIEGTSNIELGSIDPQLNVLLGAFIFFLSCLVYFGEGWEGAIIVWHPVDNSLFLRY